MFFADTKSEKNIRDKKNMALGIVNNTSTSLIKRPYGKHNFKVCLLALF